MNAFFGWMVNGIGDAMGLSGGGGGFTAMGSGGWIGMDHGGGIVGHESIGRNLPLALFDSAPRAHAGGLLQPGEIPIIAQAGERVLSVQQTRIFDALMSRPIQQEAPANANDRPFAVNIHEAPGTRASVKQTKGADGSFSLDVMVDNIDRALAQKSRKGRSALVQSMENTHGIKRTPLG